MGASKNSATESRHEKKRNYTPQFDFVHELTDERIAKYGVATHQGYMNSNYSDFTMDAKPTAPEVFNYYLADEFEARHGHRPDWYITRDEQVKKDQKRNK